MNNLYNVISIKKVERLKEVLYFVKSSPNDIEEYAQERGLSCYICWKYRSSWVMVYDDQTDRYVSVCWHCIDQHNIPIQK